MYQRIIVIVGMPRSGTSWLSQIIDSCPNVRFRLSPIFSFEFKNMVDERSDKSAYENLFNGAYLSNSKFMQQSYRREANQYPIFAQKDTEPEILTIKMTRFHNLLSQMLGLFDNLKVVAIVRHPCGAINSWLTTPGEFPKDADPLSEWRYAKCRKTAPEEFWGFEDWKKVTRLHLQLRRKYPDRFSIVQYEKLLDAPMDGVKQLFEFLKLPFTSQTEQFLIESHTRHDENQYSVYKNKQVVRNKWQIELAESIKEEIINEISGTDLERFLV